LLLLPKFLAHGSVVAFVKFTDIRSPHLSNSIH